MYLVSCCKNVGFVAYKALVETHLFWSVYPGSDWLWLPLWLVLKVILWEMISWKRSHFWMWKEGIITRSDLAGYQLAIGMGNPELTPRNTRLRNLICTNFTWTKVSTFKPVDYEGKYRLGIINEETGVIQVCSLILEGEIAALIGPKDGKFFALAYDRKNKKAKKLIRLESLRHGLSKYEVTVPVI